MSLQDSLHSSLCLDLCWLSRTAILWNKHCGVFEISLKRLGGISRLRPRGWIGGIWNRRTWWLLVARWYLIGDAQGECWSALYLMRGKFSNQYAITDAPLSELGVILYNNWTNADNIWYSCTILLRSVSYQTDCKIAKRLVPSGCTLATYRPFAQRDSFCGSPEDHLFGNRLEVINCPYRVGIQLGSVPWVLDLPLQKWIPAPVEVTAWAQNPCTQNAKSPGHDVQYPTEFSPSTVRCFDSDTIPSRARNIPFCLQGDLISLPSRQLMGLRILFWFRGYYNCVGRIFSWSHNAIDTQNFAIEVPIFRF